MAAIFCLIFFNYNLLRGAKDALLITAAGAEAIPFIKVWVMIPMALISTLLFTRFSNRYSRDKVFQIMLGSFLAFFFLFTFFLFPFRESLHLHGLADFLQDFLPTGCKGFISLIRYWSFTLFYAMCDLWSTIILTVLLWGFANEVTSVKEAKRFYALFMVGANFSGVISGKTAVLLSSNSFNPHLFYGTTAWEQSVLYLNLTVIVIGLGVMAIYRWFSKNILSPAHNLHFAKPEKIKMSLRKNFSYLAKSKYLIAIAAIVVTYNLALNLIEVVWKDQVNIANPDPSHYLAYMGGIMTDTGIIATLISLFISGFILRKFSWTFNALITPVVMIATGFVFFFFLLFQNFSISHSIAASMGSTPLFLSILFGGLQNALSRGSKYTFFDATKEIAFIPLSAESKLKGKAAIDGVGSRIGKSGGAILYQGLLMIFGSLSASAPVVSALFLAVVVIWVGAVMTLGKQFNSLVALNEKLPIPTPEKREKATEIFVGE